MPEITSDDALLAVAKNLLKEVLYNVKKGEYIIFPIEQISISPEIKTNKLDFVKYQFTKVKDINFQEMTRLVGVVIYHLCAGISEFNRESFLIDGYRKPLNFQFWPLVLVLLNEEIKSIDDLEKLIGIINKRQN